MGGPPSNKKVSSFCLSESIDLMGCFELLESKGFKPQPYKNFFFFFIKKSNQTVTTASVQSRSRENSPKLMSSPPPNEIEMDKIDTHSNINNINVPTVSPNNLYGFSLDRQPTNPTNQYLHPNFYPHLQHNQQHQQHNQFYPAPKSPINSATPNSTPTSQLKLEEFEKNHSLVVVYEYGVVVSWDLPQHLQVRTLNLFENFLHNPLSTKLVDEMTFEKGIDETCIFKDQIFLSDYNYDTKLCISHSLSQSIRVSLLEEHLNKILYLTKNIPSQLVKKGTVGISHPQLGVVVGGVFKIKKSITKNSTLFKSVTSNYFSQNPTNKQVYNLTSNYLEIKERSHSINNNISSINDMVSVCRSELETKSSYRLEMTVIILIFFELLFMILQFIYSIK
ncbi:hypothetical protein DICPUDRAFT_99478 [Dictyostelium purpureum]|uniref:DUF155 domain-containing protein n=1 Tax=Dictyostelium purpureum TaxID=5786 RepID=F0ZZJ1_DICPU|nr:uncharacterized protein DICPUDRAFT_99478 [Dictyostelium purpureum]EGC30629.1 hypothetical protein DICPUDRAFT_99478 [Dictyostelium purpureum]|eukprot:XP_003292835.1 hypothetical protein DICPUDRAFT_99478 [Dictyostelium purpureum]